MTLQMILQCLAIYIVADVIVSLVAYKLFFRGSILAVLRSRFRKPTPAPVLVPVEHDEFFDHDDPSHELDVENEENA